jgi:small subunit ribosomal protein S13
MATVRIAGQTLKGKQNIRFALTPIKGIGKNNVKDLLQSVYTNLGEKFGKDFKMTKDEFMASDLEDFSEDQLVIFRNTIENDYLVEADLRRKEQADIRRLIEIGTYRGQRHQKKLPVRGQRTKTNSRTVRGNVRLTKGSGKVKTGQKT